MPMHQGGEVDKEVVSRRRRYGEVTENLQVKEVVVGEWHRSRMGRQGKCGSHDSRSGKASGSPRLDT